MMKPGKFLTANVTASGYSTEQQKVRRRVKMLLLIIDQVLGNSLNLP